VKKKKITAAIFHTLHPAHLLTECNTTDVMSFPILPLHSMLDIRSGDSIYRLKRIVHNPRWVLNLDAAKKLTLPYLNLGERSYLNILLGNMLTTN